jgi:hypothetical protein
LSLDDVTYGWIRNTMELTRMAVSENVRAAVEQNSLLEIEGTIDLEFDAAGDLISPFVEVAAATN